jgi:hypothetical protein
MGWGTLRAAMRAILPVPANPDPPTLSVLRDGARPGDWILVNSGGVNRPADPANVQARAARLAATFPGCPIYAFTSGIANVEALSAALRPPVVGVFYDYEPNYPNEPEFSFDPVLTSQNLTRARGAARARGLDLVAYLTGQGIFNPQHTWDYGSFRGSADVVVVQSQLALRHGRWGEALDRLSRQFAPETPPVQITVTPGLPNAVDLPTALAGYDELVRRGYSSVVLWWVPGGLTELRALLDHRSASEPRAPAPPS